MKRKPEDAPEKDAFEERDRRTAKAATAVAKSVATVTATIAATIDATSQVLAEQSHSKRQKSEEQRVRMAIPMEELQA